MTRRLLHATPSDRHALGRIAYEAAAGALAGEAAWSWESLAPQVQEQWCRVADAVAAGCLTQGSSQQIRRLADQRDAARRQATSAERRLAATERDLGNSRRQRLTRLRPADDYIYEEASFIGRAVYSIMRRPRAAAEDPVQKPNAAEAECVASAVARLWREHRGAGPHPQEDESPSWMRVTEKEPAAGRVVFALHPVALGAPLVAWRSGKDWYPNISTNVLRPLGMTPLYWMPIPPSPTDRLPAAPRQCVCGNAWPCAGEGSLLSAHGLVPDLSVEGSP